MGGKPKGSASLNPWEALFASATRPRAVISSYNADEKKKNDTSDVSSNCKSTNISTTTTNNTKGGYTILIQHSITPKSQRQYALSSTMAQNNNNTTDKSSNSNKGSSSTSLYTSLSSGISAMNINNRSHHQHKQQGAISSSSSGGYGISGPFLVQQSFDELCHKCNGAVIFVSTIGNSSILHMNECMSNSGICDDEMMVDSIYQAASDNDNDGNNTQHPLEKHRNAIQMFKRHGACVDLSSNPFGWDDDDDDDSDNTEGKDECDSFVHKCSMNKLQPIANAIRKAALSIESRRGLSLEEQSQQQTKQQQQLHQPIPIVFESMTPLLNVHGVDKVCVLLKSLGRVALSSTSNQSTTKNIILLSPIVVPVLYESLQPSEHRSLEDVSDAFVHLNLADNSSNSVHRHESSSNDYNSTQAMSGVMDLVRRGGRGGLGGKLIRHCIPFHIMKSVSNSSSTIIDERDSCYWVLDHDEDEANAKDNDNKKKGGSVKSKKDISSGATNQQQDSSDTSATTATTPSRPRIYLQDDDPEYDDYDEEEDLDDDLDL